MRTMIYRWMLGFAVLAWLVSPSANAIEPVEKPTNIYAVVAGVLQWPGNALAGFPTKHRKDEELHETLLVRGVPAKNMRLLLDEQATYSGIQRAVRDVAGAAPADATLFFYYCGHGFEAKAGDVCFANYDLNPKAVERTGLLASDIAKIIGKSFKGKRVILLADCCCSGGLSETGKTLAKAGFEVATLTSSDASTLSTGNWTFTQSIIDSLKGDSLADANRDGTVTLGEMAGEVKEAMRVLERQKSHFSTHGLSSDFPVATSKASRPVADKAAIQPGQYVLAPDGKRTRPARVVKIADAKCTVVFFDYTDKRAVEVSVKDLSAIPDDWGTRPKVAMKAEIEVEWKETWYPAVVLKKDGIKSFVHYVNFDDTWDEWVTAERMRPLRK